MLTIYHNPRCRKSREALALIQQKDREVQVIEYLKTPPTNEELVKIIKLLGIEPCALIRRQEKIFKEVYRDKNLSGDQCIAAMAQHPILIERPIVLDENQAIVGRPPERVLQLM